MHLEKTECWKFRQYQYFGFSVLIKGFYVFGGIFVKGGCRYICYKYKFDKNVDRTSVFKDSIERVL